MGSTRAHTWQDIQSRIRANIANRTWCPGALIPGEVALAEQFGCSRTTVNRALRELAATGIIDRKRKAGTRVAELQARQVRAAIPIIRVQVESQNLDYSFKLLESKSAIPGKPIQERLELGKKDKALHVQSVHFADCRPYIYEDRWINTKTIPDIKSVDLGQISANEWLVQYVPFTTGNLVVEASKPSQQTARALALEVDTPVLMSRRTTWLENQSVTTVELSYAPGYQMQFEI